MSKRIKSIMREIYDKYSIIRKIYYIYRKIYYSTMDIIDRLLGWRGPVISPLIASRKIFRTDGCRNALSYKKTGEARLKHLIELGGLKPNEKILDVGCGTGRIAVPLTKYIDETGRYEGFDIVKEKINWCKKISAKHPNFRFQHVDLFNKSYNPKGKLKASKFKFPFQNDSFDFVLLHSVFTHMLPQDMENYLREIARVLKRGGRCFISFFLLNKESLQLINIGKSYEKFKCDFGLEKNRTISANTPEAAVAYDEVFVLGLYEKYGLRITQPIRYGSWCGRSNFFPFYSFLPRSLYSYSQDVIIASKG